MIIHYRPREERSAIEIESLDDMKWYTIIENLLTIETPKNRLYFINQRAREKAAKRKQKYEDWDGKRSLLKNATFPSGLFYLIVRTLDKAGAEFETNVVLPKHCQYKLRLNKEFCKTLRPAQKKSVNKILALHEKWGWTRKVLNIPIGIGKSYILANFTKIFPGTTSILVVESRSLYEQYLEYPEIVELNTTGVVHGKVNLTMVDFYRKNFEEITTIDIHFLLLDEVHLEEIKGSVMKWPVKYLICGIIGSTATLPDDRGELLQVMSYISSSVFKLRYTDAYENPPRVLIIENKKVHPDYMPRMKYAKLYTLWAKDPHRNKGLLRLIRMYPEKKFVVIFEKVTNHLLPVAKYLSKKGVSLNIIYGKVKPKERMKRQQDLRDDKVQVSLVSGVLKAGIDIDQADVLVFFAPYCSKIPVIQFSGRIIRGDDESISKKLIVDFYDSKYKHFRTHGIKRKRIYQQQGWKIEKMNLEDMNQLRLW